MARLGKAAREKTLRVAQDPVLGWAQQGEKQSMERLLSWQSLHHAVGEMAAEPQTVTVPSNLDEFYTNLEDADDEEADGIFF